MNLQGVMEEVSTALETIEGLRVFPYWVDRITPPSAIVGLPDPYNYDGTFNRGMDTLTLPIYVVVGKADSKSAIRELSQYADGSGTHSVKQAVDGYEVTACDSATVQSVEFSVISIAGIDYLAGVFDVSIIGSGS